MKIFFIVLILIISAFAQDDSSGFDMSKVESAMLSSGGLDSIGVSTLANVSDEANYVALTFRIILILLLLFVAIFTTVWLLKKSGISGSSKLGGGSMDFLEALPLGPNRSIILIRVMDTVLVLGQSASSISLLEKIDGEKAVEIIATGTGGTSIVQFKDIFSNFMGNNKK